MAEKDEKEKKEKKETKEVKGKKAEKVINKEVKKEKTSTKKEDSKTKETKKVEKKEEKTEDKAAEKEKEVKVDTENIEEKIEEVEAEIIEEVKEKNDSKTMINIIAIVLILLTIALGFILVFTKPSPKQAANDFLSLSLKNPKEAIIKYGISEFSENVEREKGKYTTYNITNVEKVEIKDGIETVKVHYIKKGPNAYKVVEEALKKLEDREITQESENFNKEFLKEFKILLKEKKDQLEEVEDVLTLQRLPGERNWTVVDLNIY